MRCVKLVRDCAEVRYVCGYGLVIKKEKRKTAALSRGADWQAYT